MNALNTSAPLARIEELHRLSMTLRDHEDVNQATAWALAPLTQSPDIAIRRLAGEILSRHHHDLTLLTEDQEILPFSSALLFHRTTIFPEFLRASLMGGLPVPPVLEVRVTRLGLERLRQLWSEVPLPLILKEDPREPHLAAILQGADFFGCDDLLEQKVLLKAVAEVFCLKITSTSPLHLEADFTRPQEEKILAQALSLFGLITPDIELTGSVQDEASVERLTSFIKKDIYVQRLVILGREVKRGDTTYLRGRLGLVGGKLLALALVHNFTLKKLELEIGAGSALQPLGGALRANHTLTHLSIGHGNPMKCTKYVLKALEVNQGLTHLNLNHNLLEAPRLARLLERNQTIQVLNVHSCSLFQHGVGCLGKSLKENKTLQELNLGDAFIGDTGILSFSEGLINHPTLARLSLYRNHLQDKGVEGLSIALNPQVVTHLNLEMNTITAGGMVPLARFVTLSSHLTHLNLARCDVPDLAVALLASALQSNPSLKTLDLGWNLIGLPGSQALGQALQTNTRLEELLLYGNQEIGAQGAVALTAGLKANHTLKKLNLAQSDIKDVGASAVAEWLTTNSTLEHLDLGENKIDEAGAIAVASALKTHRQLKTFHFGYNSVHPQGAEVLADAIQDHPTLRELNLWDCKLKVEGGKAIASALAVNQTLKKVCLGYNCLEMAGAQALASAIEQNRSLKELTLSSSRIPVEGEIALDQALSRNHTLKRLRLDNNSVSSGVNPTLTDPRIHASS